MGLVSEIVVEPWFVYLIECQNGHLYTGAARDVRARFLKHLSGKGARYTRMHRPYCLRLVIECDSKKNALKLEYAIKQYTSQQKRDLCKEHEKIEVIHWVDANKKPMRLPKK